MKHRLKYGVLTAVLACLIGAGGGNSGPRVFAQGSDSCNDLPSDVQLKKLLKLAAGNNAGGLFDGNRMWAAVVNRSGEVCAFATSKRTLAAYRCHFAFLFFWFGNWNHLSKRER